MDPFATLSLEPRFDLSPAEIERAYLRAVGAAHPDMGGGGADASAINAARRTLADPERRAESLLIHWGGPDRSADRGLPEGFLMEIMEIRQRIDGELAAEGAAARERWERWAQERRAERERAVAAMFAKGRPSEIERRAIRRELNAWRYIERLIEQLDPEYDPRSNEFDR